MLKMIFIQSGKPTPTQTGFFEVQIEGGALIWSKAKTGKFPTTDADFNAIYEEIQKAMK